MIAKAHRGESFSQTVEYVLQEEKKPEIVYGNFPEAIASEPDVAEIARRFNNQAALNRRVEKPLYHVSISPDSTEDLNSVDWSELADDFVKKMRLESNLVLGVVHNDTYYPNTNKLRPHLHLVINTVNCQTNKCADLYYDYFMVENLLRDFEERFDKKQEVVDERKAELQNTIDEKSKNESDESDLQTLKADVLSDLERIDNLATQIETREPNINGLDLAAYALKSVSSVAKIASLFLDLISSKQDLEQESLKLNAVLERAKDLEQLNPQLLPSEDRFAIEEISVECLPEFIDKAERLIEQQRLLVSSSDKDRPRLASESDECTVEKDEVFDKFLSYFQTVDSLNGQPNKKQYRVKGRTFGEVVLDNSRDNKGISIQIRSESVYSSRFEREKQQWSVAVDKLGENEKRLINQLPQSENEVRRRQNENYLADHLDREFDRPNAPGKITWFFGEGERDFYDFYRQKDSNGKRLIKGVEAVDRNIVFKAEVSAKGAIDVTENNISTQRLEQFIKWQDRSRHQASQTQNSRRQR